MSCTGILHAKRWRLIWDKQLFSWRNFFLALDRGLKLYERVPWKPLRQRALRQAREWMLEHLERSEGLAAIYPAMMNAIFALLALGHSPDDPLTAREINEFSRFEIEEGDTIRVAALCFAGLGHGDCHGCPGRGGTAARSSGAGRSGGLAAAKIKLCGPGDWMLKTPGVMPGGWAFEFRNDFYPDVDDTAFVLMALQRVDYPDKARMEAATRRGLAWLLAMQNDDGGWGAFDHNNDRQFLCQIPFADHNAMIDPSTADVTARVVECLGRYGWPVNSSGDPAGREILAEGSDRGRIMVWPLGRELRVRNQRRAARARNGCADRAGILPARSRMAALGAKFRRRIR